MDTRTRRKEVVLQNLKNSLRSYEDIFSRRVQIPKDLFNSTDFFAMTEQKFSFIKEALRKIEALFTLIVKDRETLDNTEEYNDPEED